MSEIAKGMSILLLSLSFPSLTSCTVLGAVVGGYIDEKTNSHHHTGEFMELGFEIDMAILRPTLLHHTHEPEESSPYLCQHPDLLRVCDEEDRCWCETKHAY